MGAVQCTDINASGAITGDKGRIFVGAVLMPAAANSTLILYDNSAGSGKVIGRLASVANGPSAWLGPLHLPVGIGIYATITGASATAVIYYE